MIRAAILGAMLLAAAAPAQQSAPESRDAAAEALLASIDARTYSAEQAGMSSVSFSYVPPSTGTLGLPEFRVRATWTAESGESVGFVGKDGKPLAELPEAFRRPSPNGGPTPQESFERGAKGLIAVFRGVPYATQFKDWNKRLETRIVNGRAERTIVCEPAIAKYVQRVEMLLDRRNLPWRIVSVLVRPEGPVDRFIDDPAWEEFDGKLVMSGFKKTRGAATEQIKIDYQRKDGFIVPASYDRLEPGKPPVRIVFEDVEVGTGPASAPARERR